MSTSTFEKLRQQLSVCYADHLPPQIHYADSKGARISKPLGETTLDEVAFAIQGIVDESNRLLRSRAALEEIYTGARRRGAVGATPLSTLIEGKSK